MLGMQIRGISCLLQCKETIDIAVNLISNSNTNLHKKTCKLFLFAISQTYFLFNVKFWPQIGVVAMGSPLAIVFANTFIGHRKTKWLINYYDLNQSNFFLDMLLTL